MPVWGERLKEIAGSGLLGEVVAQSQNLVAAAIPAIHPAIMVRHPSHGGRRPFFPCLFCLSPCVSPGFSMGNRMAMGRVEPGDPPLVPPRHILQGYEHNACQGRNRRHGTSTPAPRRTCPVTACLVKRHAVLSRRAEDGEAPNAPAGSCPAPRCPPCLARGALSACCVREERRRSPQTQCGSAPLRRNRYGSTTVPLPR